VRRLLCALALGLTAAIAFAGAAHAHQGNPDFNSEIDGIEPPVDGLEAEILNYDADVVLTNDSGETVIVEGYEGEPYLRFAPDGAVEANVRSPAYYLNTDRYGEADVPASADPEADPEWTTVAGTGEYQWHDHRSHYMSRSVPPQVTDEGARTKVFDYEIPLQVDGRPVAIHGTLYWVGSGATPVLPFVVLAIIAIGSIVLVVVVRRRRSASSGGATDHDSAKDGDDGGCDRGREAW
jgi:hypothetical protein